MIRDGDRVRLVFRPQIVDNTANPHASIDGRFLYQRKGTKDEWLNFDNLRLSSLKNGEGYQLSLKAGELLKLFQEFGALYRLYRREGVPQGKMELLKVGQPLSELLSLAETDLLAFLSTNSHDAVQTLRAVLQWFSKQAVAQGLLDNGEELPELNALVGLANLRSVLKTWSVNAENKNEEFWQGLFSRHSFVLSQLFAYPVVLIKGKAYVGGKETSNRGGNIADFLYRVESSGAAVLIEIKTPQARLLGAEYRGVFPASTELSGAISQVLEYGETLSAGFHAIGASKDCLSIARPYCVVILGDASRELVEDARKRSFERFRERLVGVRIVTFDEVFRRIEELISLLEGS